MRGRREDEFRGFPFSRRVVAPMRGCRAAAPPPASESPWPPKTVGGFVAVVLIATAACFTRPVEATSPQPNMWSPNEGEKLLCNFAGYHVVREESRHREKKGGSQVTARARERERRRYSM